jgi:hypothetical protein
LEPKLAPLRKLAVRNRAVWRSLQLLIAGASVAFLLSKLGEGWQVLRTLHFQLAWFLAAGGVVLVAVFLGGFSWWLILRSLGEQVAWQDALRAHLISNLAKYLPGYGWQLGSKFLSTREFVASKRTISIAMTIELFQLGISGMVIGLLSFPLALPILTSAGGLSVPVLRNPPSVLLILAAPMSLLAIIVWIMRKHPLGIVRPGQLLLATLMTLTGWLLLAMMLFLLGMSLSPMSWSSIPAFTFATSVSFLAGLAIPLLPAGIGVREGIMVAVLGTLMNPALSVVLAGLSRVLIMICELLSLGAFELMRIFDARTES